MGSKYILSSDISENPSDPLHRLWQCNGTHSMEAPVIVCCLFSIKPEMFMTPTITNAMKFITYTALGVVLN